MQKQRISITVKILSGLFLILVVTLFTVGIGTFFFRDIRNNVRDMSQNKISGLILGAELVQESQRLLSRIPDIFIAKNEFIRTAIIRESKTSIQHKNGLIDTLSEKGTSPERLETLSKQFDNVVSGMNKLRELINRQLKAEDRMNRVSRRIQAISDTINGDEWIKDLIRPDQVQDGKNAQWHEIGIQV